MSLPSWLSVCVPAQSHFELEKKLLIQKICIRICQQICNAKPLTEKISECVDYAEMN